MSKVLRLRSRIAGRQNTTAEPLFDIYISARIISLMGLQAAVTGSKIEVFFSPETLSLPAGLDAWLLSVKSKIGKRIFQNLDTDTDDLDRYIEIIEVDELPGAFIACSFYQRDINDALTRAGIFMGAGKGTKAGTLIHHQNYSLRNYKKLVAGHNLPGPLIQSFFSELERTEDVESRANTAEQAIADEFLKAPRIKQLASSFYVIGFSIQTMKDQKGVISHELFHAYMFLNETYRNVILEFWRDVVSPEDKVSITTEIGLVYNIDNEDLVIDEFQAYLIQNNAELDRMKAFVPKYRAPLLRKLSQAKISILKV